MTNDMKLEQYTTYEDKPIWICPDMIVAISVDTTILNAGDITGIMTESGTYYTVKGAASDIAAHLQTLDSQ